MFTDFHVGMKFYFKTLAKLNTVHRHMPARSLVYVPRWIWWQKEALSLIVLMRMPKKKRISFS